VFTRRSNNSWLKMSSAILGGFLLGFSYKKYGKEMEHHIKKITRKPLDYEDYTDSHEPDA